MIRIFIRLLKVIKKYNLLVRYIERKQAYTYGLFVNCSTKAIKEQYQNELDVLNLIRKFIDDLEEHDDGKI